MKYFWIFILLIKVNHAVSQTVNRTILDKQTNSPLPYATIKILHAPGGTISSNKGEFHLTIADRDSILFSCVGYYQKILVGKEIGTEIYLEPKIKILEAVTLKDKKRIRTIVLGNTDKNIKWDENWGLSKEGKDEFAQKIELPDSLLFYKVKKIYIPVKKIVCWGPLLLHIYAADTVSENPGEELLTKPLYISKKDVYHSKAAIDISSENLYLYHSKSFFAGISSLQDSAREKCLTTVLLSKSSNARTYSRTLYHSTFAWFPFGLLMDWSINPNSARTYYSVEVDEMK